MKILITGVNGFIGRNLAEHLISEGNEVHGLDRSKNSYIKLDKYYMKDIQNEFSLSEEYDYIIHLAAISRTNVDVDYNYETIRKANVDGVINTIASCKFKKFIFFSSVLVYSRNKLKISEDSEICLDSLYSKTKYEAENVIKKLLSEEQYIILRLANVVGVEQKYVAFMPIFFEKAVKNEKINIFVPANKIMQLLDVDDLSQLIVKIVKKKNNAYGIYNVAPKEYISIAELVNKILQVTNSKSDVIYSNNETAVKSVIEAQKVRETFKWDVSKSVNDILSEFYIQKYKNSNLH